MKPTLRTLKIKFQAVGIRTAVFEDREHIVVPVIALMEGVIHEPKTISMILQHRGDGILIHAGAYIGDMLPAFSGKGHRVYAFEPARDFFRCAKITMDLNFADGEHSTVLINKGLGDKVGEVVQLLTTEDGEISEGGASRIMRCADGVELNRLEELCLTTIDTRYQSLIIRMCQLYI